MSIKHQSRRNFPYCSTEPIRLEVPLYGCETWTGPATLTHTVEPAFAASSASVGPTLCPRRICTNAGCFLRVVSHAHKLPVHYIQTAQFLFYLSETKVGGLQTEFLRNDMDHLFWLRSVSHYVRQHFNESTRVIFIRAGLKSLLDITVAIKAADGGIAAKIP